MAKNANPKRNRAPYLVRKGTVKGKNLRTHVKGGNHKEIFITTQGYDSEKARVRAEEIALEALFRDPALKETALRLADEVWSGPVDRVLDGK